MNFIILIIVENCHNIITYNNLPQKYQDITKLVIKENDYNIMLNKYDKNKLVCMPSYINNLFMARKWINERYINKIYYLINDSLVYKKRIYENNKWLYQDMLEYDYDNMFNKLYNNVVNNDYVISGVSLKNNIIKKYPESIITKQTMNFMINNIKLKELNIQWCRTKMHQETDLLLQLFNKKKKNIIINNYVIIDKNKNNILTEQLLTEYNNCQILFNELWKNNDIIVPYKKIINYGPLIGKEKIALKIFYNKCYKMALI